MTISQLLYDTFAANGLSVFINTINALVFIIGLFILIRAMLLLKVNRNDLAILENILRKQEEIPKKDDLLSIANTSGFHSNGVILRILGALNSLSKTSMEDRDKLMQIEDIRNEARTALPKAVPGLAVSIGFFGTVVGLFWAIDSMPAMFRVEGGLASEAGLQGLTASMVSALDGMRTAFGTTIVGLVSAVALAIGNVIYKVFYDRYDHRLQRAVILKVYPSFAIPEKDNLIDKLVEIMNASRETLRTIEHSNSRLVQSVGDLAANMGTYNRDNEKIIKHVASVVKEFLESQKTVKEVHESINSIAKEMHGSYARIQGLLDSGTHDREAFLAYLQDSRNEIVETGKIQHEMYSETNKAFLRHLDTSMEENLERVVKTYNTFQQNFTDTQQCLIDKAVEEYKQLSENNGQLTREVVEGLRKSLEEFKTNVVQNNDQYEKQTQKLIKEMSGILQKVIESNSIAIGAFK